MTIRAKSLQAKRKRLLAESIRFQRRLDIMRKRRAQFFAPAVKMIDVDRAELIKKYDEYVMNKRRIKLDPFFINEERPVPKKILYRPASTEALLKHRDVMIHEACNPLKGKRKPKALLG